MARHRSRDRRAVVRLRRLERGPGQRRSRDLARPPARPGEALPRDGSEGTRAPRDPRHAAPVRARPPARGRAEAHAEAGAGGDAGRHDARLERRPVDPAAPHTAHSRSMPPPDDAENPRPRFTFMGHIRNWLLTGLIALAPLAVTLYVFFRLFNWVDN